MDATAFFKRLAEAIWKADVDAVVAMHTTDADRDKLKADGGVCLCYEYAALAPKFTASDMLETARLSGCLGVGFEAIYTACAMGDIGKLEALHTIDAQRAAEGRLAARAQVYAITGLWRVAAEAASIDSLEWLRIKYPCTDGRAAAFRAAARTHGERSLVYEYMRRQG